MVLLRYSPQRESPGSVVNRRDNFRRTQFDSDWPKTIGNSLATFTSQDITMASNMAACKIYDLQAFR